MGESYLLASGFAPSGPGAGGGPSRASSHISPIFAPNDLFSVWFLSLLPSIAAGIFPA